MATVGASSHTRIQLEKHVIEGFVCKSMELKWVTRKINKSSQLDKNLLRPLFPIYISTEPRHVDPHRLRDLYADCNHTCHRFPSHVLEPVDIHKLRIALSHSAVLVSVFCKPNVIAAYDDGFGLVEKLTPLGKGVEDFLQSVTPVVTPSDGELVGFGRAVSDCGLTASIYDVMCLAGYTLPAENGNWSDDS